MNQSIFDITIVGGGIVGLATAFQLQKYFPDYSICIIEKETQVAMHQTGHNSGVIHSGIYYQPGSLKAKLCVEGVRALLQFADQNNIPYELCGKVIIAADLKEAEWLKRLFERGAANGVYGLELIDSDRIKELEPNAAGILGVYSPKTGIINYSAVAQSLAKQIVVSGGTIHTNCRLTSIKSTGTNFVLNTNKGVFQSRWFINCAGLHSDEVAQMAGLKPKVRIIPFRGEYWLIRQNRRHLVKNLVYPVPIPEMPFLGAHFTRSIDGEREAGPNAVLALGRESYYKNQININ